MADYDSLTHAYPNPSFNNQPYHPRSALDLPPEQRSFGMSESRGHERFDVDQPAFSANSLRMDVPRFRSLEDNGPDVNDMKRTQFPPTHQLPNPNINTAYIAPFNHAMKRAGNSERMKEIFGDHQVFSSMDNLFDPAPVSKPETFHRAPDPYNGYIPRMKILDGSDIRMPMPTPVREGYSNTVNSPAVGSGQSKSSESIPTHRLKIYNAILEYFPGFSMTKTAQHGPYGVYKAPVQCLLCNGVRFAVAIVKDDWDQIGDQRPLSTLPWSSFQTRWTESDDECRKFKMVQYPYGHPEHSSILDDTIRLTRETKNSFKYICDNLPLQVEILKMRQDETMAETGSVSTALEQFNTIISWSE